MDSTTALILVLTSTAVSLWAYIRAYRRRTVLRGSWLVEDTSGFAGKSSEEPVAIGHFRNYLDAEVQRIRLEAVGIPSMVIGGHTVRSMPYVQIAPPMLFAVELRVRAEDAERALEALRTVEPEEALEE